MKTYIVTLESKDKHIFECTVQSETDDGAVEEANKIIIEKCWEHYNYKLKQLYRIK